MLKLVDKLFLGNSSAKLCGFKSHCLQRILYIYRIDTKGNFFQWDIVKRKFFNKSLLRSIFFFVGERYERVGNIGIVFFFLVVRKWFFVWM